MKMTNLFRHPVQALAVFVLLGLAMLQTAKAALIVYEPMAYPAGQTLNSQSNGFGFGWTNAWQVNSTAPSNAMILAGSLQYTDQFGNQLLTTSNRVHITGDGSVSGENIGGTTATAQPFRLIDHMAWPGQVAPGSNVAVLTNTTAVQTTWLSVLMRRTGAAILTNTAFHPGIYYNRAWGMQYFNNSQEVLTAGRGSQNSETNTTWPSDTYAIYMKGNAAFGAVTTNYLTNTSLIVIRVDHRGGFADNVLSNISVGGVYTNADTAYMWVNPANLKVEPDTNASVTVTSTDYGSGKDFVISRLRVFAGSLNTGYYGSGDIDEIRMGTNYFDVTPLNCFSATIATNPASLSKPENTSATFSIYANGTTPTYKWQLSTDNGSTWGDISGATSSNYTKSSLVLGDSGSKYRCIASVACDSTSVTSSVATLTVTACTSAGVATAPTNITVGAGATATFSAVGSGSEPTYQWQFSPDSGTTWINVTNGTGGTSASYTTATVTAVNNGYQYRVVVSAACDSSTSTSTAATLTVTCNTAGVTTSPANSTTLVGGVSTFTVVGSGSLPTYQWQSSTDNGSTWNNISGATSTSYTRTNVLADNGSQYRALVNVSCDSSSATSGVAVLTVADPAGSSFRSAATGAWSNNATWQLSTDNGATWISAPGTPTFANSTNITIQSGHTVNVTTPVTIDDTTVNSGGILASAGGLITVTNSSTTVNGLLSVTNVVGSGLSTNATASMLTIGSGGKFVWNFQSQIIIPLATWNNGSSLNISNYSSGTVVVIGFSGQSYYDIVLNGLSVSSRPQFSMTADTVIRHDMTIILPDFAGATTSLISGSGVTLSISNNLNITTGTTANSTKVLINQSAAAISTVKVGGNININGNIDGFGGSSLLWQFVKAGTQTYNVLNVTNVLTPTAMSYQVDSGSTLQLLQDVTNCAAFTVNNGGALDVGTKVITGTGFTLNSGATLTTANPAGITTSGATGSIQTSSRSYSTGASYVYNGTAAQTLGNGLPATVANLTLASGMTNAVTVSNGAGNSTPYYTVTGTLTPNSAKINYAVSGAQLDYGTYNLFSYGALSGSFNATVAKTSGSAKAAADLSQAGGFISLVFSNHAPVAVADSFSRAGGLAIKIKKADLVANDTDVDADTLTVSAVDATTANSATITSDATYIYLPAATASDSFGYTVSDGNGGTANGTVTVGIVTATGQATGSINTSGGNPNLTFFGIPGYSYTIQVSTDMTSWTDVTTITCGSTGVMTYTDTTPPTPVAFYRARYNP